MGRVVHPHIITPDSALGGLDIKRSVRCGNGGAFRRTPSVTGNQKVWTWSAWVKKWFTDGGTHHLFSSQGSNNGISAIYFNGDNIHTYFDTTGTNPYGAVNSREYRDPNSWMHIVWQVDALNTDQRIWINGQEESITSSNDPPNYAYSMNEAGKRNSFGESAYGGSHTNGTYFAEMHHSDGYKYDPSYYGYTDPQTGIWRPKKVTGISYGTNGFYLDFSDNSTAAALGKDRSGNGNDWSTNGSISVANDKTNDSSLDTPTNNFCTLNPVRRQNDNCNLDEGNLQASGSSTSYPGAVGSIALSSGKWYYEFQIDTYATSGNDPMCGICRNSYVSGGAGRIVYRAGGNYITSTPSEPSDPDAYAVGDIIGVAIDLDDAAGKIRFYKNGSLQPILANGDLDDVKSDLSISSLGGVFPYVQMYTNDVCTVNFGQRPFTYTPPSGHKKLIVNTNNNSLDNSTPSVIDPKNHFNTLIYSGNSNDSSGNVVTGLEFQPDFIWIKARSGSSSPGSQNHYLVDSVRGATGSVTKKLFSNSTAVENSGQVDSHNGVNILHNGFKLTSNDDGTNANNEYVAWCWKAGGPAVSNTDGDVTSQVSVNEEAGFSIVSFTTPASGSGFSIGHGLSKAPEVILMKNRSYANNWDVYHHKNGSDPEQYRLILNSNTARQDQPYLDDTVPTSSVFRTRGNNQWYPGNNEIIAYCWYAVPGYSAFGSYIGDGSGDGPFLNIGFTPRWILLKCATNAERWVLMDTKRPSGGNFDDYNTLSPNETAAENSSGGTTNDFFANGFKMLGGTDRNISGQTHVYMAFAETPQSSPITDTQSGAR